MFMTTKKKIALIIGLSALILLLAIFLLFYFNWQINQKDKLPPQTFIGQLNLSGKTQSEILKIINAKQENFAEKGIEFKYGEKVAIFPLKSAPISPDIPGSDLKYAESVIFDNEESVFNLFSSQKNNFFRHVISRFCPEKKYEYRLSVYYSPEIFAEWLSLNFPELNVKAEPAYFSLEKFGNQTVIINNQEKIGKEINLEELYEKFKNSLATLNSETIIVTTRSTYPEIKQADLEKLRPEAEKLLALDDFVVYFFEEVNKKTEKIIFKITPEEIITWLSAKKTGSVLTTTFNEEKIANYLDSKVASKINKAVLLPRFEMNNGKVTSWQGGKNGREVNLLASAKEISTALQFYNSEAELKINELKTEDLNLDNDFKITELLGTGHSNFAGSSANRRHNIAVGADAVHGVLIKPGEEFSLVAALGEVSAAAGYLPELVIKGDKTIPEYGGGLCQIATTIFRSALDTGLPITARRNHSYRVRYYEPAGVDAAVYDPWPDVKFINDMANYILIQSRIEKNDIYIDFWGTSDGRTATITTPVIYNVKKPPATKIIETADLKPGQKRCTESAHYGADTYFDYIVIYPEGATTTPRQETRFSSHYVPWQEVCLIGKAEESAINEGQNESVNNSNNPTEALPSENNNSSTNGNVSGSQN